MEKRRFVQGQMEKVFKKYGYREIATPTIEHLELFELKSGEAIIDELYSFRDKGNRNITLRPELTAPVMRFYVEQFQMETKPLKFFYFGNCFRYDRPQEGRYREFWQMGCELIGSSNPEAIAELIVLAYNVIKNTGLIDVQLRIGNLNLLGQQIKDTLPPGSISDALLADQAEILRAIDKNDMESVEHLLKNRNTPTDKISNFIDFLECDSIGHLKDYFRGLSSVEADIGYFEKILEFLELFNVPTGDVLDMKIARGLDYYRGVVFELEAPKLGAEKQLCGGGSYELVSLLGGREIPTAGFAIGFDRVMMALGKEGYEFPLSHVLIYVTALDRTLDRDVIKIAARLRKSGFIVDFDLMKRSIAKSLKYANKIGAQQVIILGKDEWDGGKLVVKNMLSGDQQEINIMDLEKFLA